MHVNKISFSAIGSFLWSKSSANAQPTSSPNTYQSAHPTSPSPEEAVPAKQQGASVLFSGALNHSSKSAAKQEVKEEQTLTSKGPRTHK